MHSTSIEIMAPVGSYDALTAAIHAGANSVYFGVAQLNMRARNAGGFTLEDIFTIQESCGKAGVKTYITLNTVLYDHDMKLMKKIVDTAKKAGISAVIAADHAVMNYAKSVGLPVHISTQANITNIETIAFYANFADVMVLSRELNLGQIQHITQQIKKQHITGPSGELVRIEIFAHGALCMAVSGKCYLSLHSHNASANRGACVQNCRRKYTVIDQEEGNELEIDNEYIMSAKDLCTIDFLDKIIEAGVHILKIEGRGRTADYVDTTIRCYREAADAIFDGTYSAKKITGWMSRLETVFNRGFWDGYYLGRKLGEWNDTYGGKATEKKVLLGQGAKYFGNMGIGEFKLESGSLKIGEKVVIMGPTTGVVRTAIQELRVNNQVVDEVQKGQIFSTPIKEKIRPSDKLYKLIPA